MTGKKYRKTRETEVEQRCINKFETDEFQIQLKFEKETNRMRKIWH